MFLPLPKKLVLAIRRHGVKPTRFILTISVSQQRMRWLERQPIASGNGPFPNYSIRRQYVISTSAFGAGQIAGSKQTPLGLHRIAQKIGGGQPIGTVFRARKPAGLTWNGVPDGRIVHRILWLEGLEAGLNRGGNVDSFNRYIYIHGFGDETTLGRPQSHGCIHLAGSDLIPLFHQVAKGTLVWIDI